MSRRGVPTVIEGRQPVREALRAGRRIDRILVARGAQRKGVLAEIVELARAAGVAIEVVEREALDERAASRAHQGVIAEAPERPNVSWREGVEAARAAGRAPLLLALDGLQDPQNVGALLRSAEVFGVDAVLLPARRAASLGPGAAKASAGAVEHLRIDRVSNLERALDSCREEGLWLVALDAEGSQEVHACDLLGEPVAVIVGAEGAGVSSLVKRRADVTVRIPTMGAVASLNASVAGAICLWEAAKRRNGTVV